MMMARCCGLALWSVSVAVASCGSGHDLQTVAQLAGRSGCENEVVTVKGYHTGNERGGGTFYFSSDASANANAGTVVDAPNGKWIRLASGPVRSSWFGVPVFDGVREPTASEANEATRRLQKALDAAAGGLLVIDPGIYYVSDTLYIPHTTRVEGAGARGTDGVEDGGTLIKTFGEGTKRRWSDTGDRRLDSFSSMIAFGGGSVRLRNIAFRSDDGWDVGVIVPASKRNLIEHVRIDGDWRLAACLLDATWSELHTELIELHGGRIRPAHLNEMTLRSCYLSGRWGLYVRGAFLRDPSDYATYKEWLWSYGGTSDMTLLDCHLVGKSSSADGGGDGGAYCHDAPVYNAAKAGQGHRFVSCPFSSQVKYLVRLEASHRDRFFNCEFEGQAYVDADGEPTVPVMKREKHPKWSTYFHSCRFNEFVDRESEWHFETTSITDPQRNRIDLWWQQNLLGDRLRDERYVLDEPKRPVQLSSRKAVDTVQQLGDTRGIDGRCVAVLGYDAPGDGGGGVFRFDADDAGRDVDGGTIWEGPNGSRWIRVDAERTRVFESAWFGVQPMEQASSLPSQENSQAEDLRHRTTPTAALARRNTLRLQNALNVAAGGSLRLGKGIYPIDDTVIVPAETRVEGRVSDPRPPYALGTSLQAFGDGTVRRWQDTGDSEKDRFRPMVVFGGNDCQLSHLSVAPGDAKWEVGVMIPTSRGANLRNCVIRSHSIAGCLMDATWSTRNRELIQLYDGKIQPADELKDNIIYCCLLRGRWALMVRGAEDRNLDDYAATDWIWAPQASSNLVMLASRIQPVGSTGGAYYHNVPAKNDKRSGEGHRCLSCRFHTDSQYSVMLNHTHGFQVAGSYFEGWGNGRPSSMVRDLENTGSVDLFSVHMVDVRQEERKVMKND